MVSFRLNWIGFRLTKMNLYLPSKAGWPVVPTYNDILTHSECSLKSSLKPHLTICSVDHNTADWFRFYLTSDLNITIVWNRSVLYNVPPYEQKRSF